MNINSMIMKLDDFNDYIVESGFLRDVQEYIKTIKQPQNSQNIILLGDITGRVLQQLTVIQESDVPEYLNQLLLDEKIKPLRLQYHIQILSDLKRDNEVDTSDYHVRLTEELNNLEAEIVANQEECDKLYNVLIPFHKKEIEVSEGAVISFIFKDIDTISDLKKFARILHRWNTTLHLYHQLVTSEKPRDIELVNIQNGSLDVVINLDINVAINFMEIVKYGFLAFNGYLLYKMRVHEIVETYYGNKKLIKAEKERENDLLNNIGDTIKSKLLEQHKKLKKKEKNINTEAVPKKVDVVSKALSEHIVKGNDIKLLIDSAGGKKEGASSTELLEETKKASLNARNYLKKLDSADKQLLLEKYTIKVENNNT